MTDGFSDKVTNGEIPLNPTRRDWLRKNEGKWLRVELEKRTRSTNQNSLLWWWFTIIGDSIGEHKNEVYRIMTGLFSPKIEVKMGNKKFLIPKGTSKMTTSEMIEFLNAVQVESSQLGIILPTPDDANNAYLINE